MENFVERFDAARDKRILLQVFKRAVGYFNLKNDY